jgi:pyruvate,water dikinase
VIGWLKRLLTPDGDERPELAELQQRFREHYASYQRLLEANGQAVETIAEIEAAQTGDRPLTMAYVRDVTTRAAGHVFKMIRALDELSENRYDPLYDRFNWIQSRLNPLLFHVAGSSAFPPIVPLAEVGTDIVEQVGTKMAVLGELTDVTGARVPDGFVITSSGYNLFVEAGELRPQIDACLAASESDPDRHPEDACHQIQRLIEAAPVPAELEDSVLGAYRDLCQREGRAVRLAVRSSALGEDSHEMSFAGQYESVLGVAEDQLLDAYKRVVASKYSLRATKYRAFYGLRDDEVAMCVGCLTMVDAAAGGVIYTRNPLDDDDRCITVYAVAGTPEPVVDGSAVADTFTVTRDDAELTRKVIVDEAHPALTDDQAARLARVALAVESRQGAAQDIEWALDTTGSITLLQSRPLAVAEHDPDLARQQQAPDGARALLRGGVTVSRGAALGPVHTVLTPADERSLETGAVLLSDRARPALAALLDRAVAVITERGSVASHLATVARERGVPALFGVQHAVTRLTPGRQVTVDADRRAVYEGAIAELLKRPRASSRVTGSPVHQALEAAAAQIVPLGLLDPEAPSFSAEGCRTFHDITRFCHEQAVVELLRFGTVHEIKQRVSRRLFTDVATQFWIVDLNDGVAEGSDDPHFVRLDEVRSVPMLALWRGIHLVPWEGPPPVDARSFLGLLAGSATDPELDPSRPSRHAAGSHFFVASSYCSFQYRVGYHLATVEALAGPSVVDNFVRFQFSGGAAAADRRQRRARLIAEVLESRAFRVKLELDVVSARLDGYDSEQTEQALVLLGFLLMHTRQLDVAMTDDAAIARHKTALLRALASAEQG